jgi:thioredoxin
MKNTFVGLIFLSIIWFSSCGGSLKSDPNNYTTLLNTSETGQKENASSVLVNDNAVVPAGDEGQVIILTKAMFLEKVYDYEKNPKTWTFKSDKPCVIDFYADWCRPCKQVAPIMAEFAEKYKGQIIVYKVNTDQERELAQFFGIRSIPTVFFCPSTGDPQMTQGALPKETFEKVITDVLLKK